MARELDDQDIRILRKLAPECEEMICSGSGVPFRSILPPVSNHFSADERDFGERLGRLTPEELGYLVRKIRDGSESVACIQPEDAGVLAAQVEKIISREAADEVMRIFETAEEC